MTMRWEYIIPLMKSFLMTGNNIIVFNEVECIAVYC